MAETTDEIVIENKRGLKEALEQYWVVSSQIKEVEDEWKAEKKKIQSKAVAMKEERKKLIPAIQNYMVKEKMSSAQSHGKIFRLQWTKTKTRLNEEEIRKALETNGIEEEDIEKFISVSQTKKETKTGKIKCELIDETSEDEV